MSAVCLMVNCRRRAPATEAFCAKHRSERVAPGVVFDLLEGVKDGLRQRGNEKAALAISAGFARGTGGVDLEYLVPLIVEAMDPAIAIETRRAETGTGSVHESAGLQGIAPMNTP